MDSVQLREREVRFSAAQFGSHLGEAGQWERGLACLGEGDARRLLDVHAEPDRGIQVLGPLEPRERQPVGTGVPGAEC